MFPFSLLREALGSPRAPTTLELPQHQDNLLGARYVRLAYGAEGVPAALRQLRRTTRLLLVGALLSSAATLLFTTLNYGKPSAGTLDWLDAVVFIAYAGDVISAGIQMLTERLRGIPFTQNKRREWALRRVLSAPMYFLETHANVPDEPRRWWYGRGTWWLNFLETVFIFAPAPLVLWIYLMGEDARLSAIGTSLLGIGLGAFLLALALAMDTAVRFSTWQGVPTGKPGYGLSVLMLDLRTSQPRLKASGYPPPETG